MSSVGLDVPDALKAITNYYRTYEEGEEQFRKSTKLIPRLYLGPQVFFTDLLESRELNAEHSKSFITADPRDCLAFTTPRQALFAAALNQRNPEPEKCVRETANAFEISDLLNQPIRTLSGGESVKLALAKAFLNRTVSSDLIISAPYSWLSLYNVKYLNNVVSAYHNLNRGVQLLSLDGQDDYAAISSKHNFVADSVRFSLAAKNLTIPLDLDAELLPDDEITLCAFNDFSSELVSPCSIVGENGSGKSLLVRSLSRAINFRGQLAIEKGGIFGRTRLITQDVLNQVLGRTIEEILYSNSVTEKNDATKNYKRLVEKFRDYFTRKKLDVPAIGPDLSELPRSQLEQNPFRNQPTILQLKFALVASRLASSPVALCIDEPEWALTKNATAGFISSVVEIAHSRNVAVLIVSNKNWWDEITKSKIIIQRSSKNWNDPSGVIFSAQISKLED